jgi:peptide/nickel transport system permease protein
LAIGGIVGSSAGYAGGLWERLVMRLVDIFQSIPVMMLAILVIAVLGASQMHLILVLALTSWVRFARISRAETLKMRRQTFILAARAIGASRMRVLFYHLLPALWPSMLTLAALEASRLLLMEASLSFLGLGAQPPAPAWGRMLADGRNYLTVAWWVAVMPGVAILLTVLAVTLLGNALRRLFEEQP